MKALYKVVIERLPPGCRAYKEGYPYIANFRKLYGDIHSRGGPFRNRDEVLADFHRCREFWEGYDSILKRMGDRVTLGNLEFHSEVPELQIKKGDLFGQATLF